MTSAGTVAVRLAALLLAAATVGLAGCGSEPGPAAVGDGRYRLFATSDSASIDAASASTLDIDSSAIAYTDTDTTIIATLGDPGDEYLVCPPSGTGTLLPLEASITVGGLEFTSPALFGDCGETSPIRVTLVDLDAVDDSVQFPFTRWAEFCDVEDADC